MDTIKINGNEYEISGYADDGLPIIKASCTSSQDGFDEEGNPKINVTVNVPPIKIGAEPGRVE
jgi:hypothetical protein